MPVLAREGSLSDEITAVRIYIVDATYGVALGDEEWLEQSKAFARGLKAEFEQDFQEENIGPGADLPAFVTALPLDVWPLLGAAIYIFFQGKEVEENFDAWSQLAKRIRRYWHRKPVLERAGAGALAVAAVIEELGRAPRKLRLTSYRPVMDFELEGAEVRAEAGIEDDTIPLNLGRLVYHEFEILADERKFVVLVSSTDINIEEASF